MAKNVIQIVRSVHIHTYVSVFTTLYVANSLAMVSGNCCLVGGNC